MKQYIKIVILGVALLICHFGIAQDTTSVFQGIIFDEFNQPMAEVSVGYNALNGERGKVFSNEDGTFEIKHSSSLLQLEVSYPGFYAIKRTVTKSSNTIFVMEPQYDFSFLAPAASATGGLRYKDYNGSTLSLPNTNNNINAESVDELLKGQTGIYAESRSGMSGDGSNILVRGLTGLYTIQKPLVVVDEMILGVYDFEDTGIPGNDIVRMTGINPSDVINITVLKGSEAAIYGMQGANGVIHITTREPLATETTVNFKASGGIAWHSDNIPLLNAEQHRSYTRSQLFGAGYTLETLEAQYPFLGDHVQFNDYPTYDQDTDWQDEVFKPARKSDFYVNLNGGDEIARFFASVGYTGNQGIIENTNMNRFTSKLRSSINITQKLSMDANVGITFRDDDFLDMSTSVIANPILSALTKSPMVGVMQATGDYHYNQLFEDADAFGMSNPVVLTEDVDGFMSSLMFIAQIKFNYVFNPQWKLQVAVGNEFNNTDSRYFRPDYGVGSIQGDETLNYALKSNDKYRSFSNDNRLTWTPDLGLSSKLTMNIGTRLASTELSLGRQWGINTGNDNKRTIKNVDEDSRRKEGFDQAYTRFSTYWHTNYIYKNKLFVNAMVSVDGSSRIGDNANEIASQYIKLGDKTFGVFPALTVGYDVFENSFFNRYRKTLNTFKINAGASIAGNDGFGNFIAKDYYDATSYWRLTGLARAGLTNTQVKWEDVYTVNLGLDAQFFSNRVNLTFDAYKNWTKDALVEEFYTPIFGFETAYINSGELEGKGLELGLGVDVIRSRNWEWNIGANVTYQKNEITKLAEDVEVEIEGGSKIHRVGEVPGQFYGFKAIGVYTDEQSVKDNYLTNRLKEPFGVGDIIFADLDNNGIIDDNDRTIIGNPMPELFGSVSTSLRFKSFSLFARMNLVGDREVYNYTRQQLEGMTGFANQTVSTINHWTKEGDITEIPQNKLDDPQGNARFSDRWIENGKFARLQDVTLSYHFDMNNTSWLNSLRLYATGKNLVTFSDYLGYDPEFYKGTTGNNMGVDYGRMPTTPTVIFGLELGF